MIELLCNLNPISLESRNFVAYQNEEKLYKDSVIGNVLARSKLNHQLWLLHGSGAAVHLAKRRTNLKTIRNQELRVSMLVSVKANIGFMLSVDEIISWLADYFQVCQASLQELQPDHHLWSPLVRMPLAKSDHVDLKHAFDAAATNVGHY